jgi:hypothetical protein
MSATSSPQQASPEALGPADGANRRRHDRIDYRTAAVAIIGTPDQFRCLRCQTDDVSFEGARLICFEPLNSQSIYLRILMPGLSERFVEADVVNEREVSELRFGVGLASRYLYGVRFRRVITDATLLEQLRNAAVQRPGRSEPPDR